MVSKKLFRAPSPTTSMHPSNENLSCVDFWAKMIKDVKPRPNRHNSTLEGSSETNIQGKTKKKSNNKYRQERKGSSVTNTVGGK